MYVHDAGTNLLGRDLMMKLVIQITICQEGITVSMNVLTETDEKDIDPMAWAKEGNRGVENNPFKNKAEGKMRYCSLKLKICFLKIIYSGCLLHYHLSGSEDC